MKIWKESENLKRMRKMDESWYWIWRLMDNNGWGKNMAFNDWDNSTDRGLMFISRWSEICHCLKAKMMIADSIEIEIHSTWEEMMTTKELRFTSNSWRYLRIISNCFDSLKFVCVDHHSVVELIRFDWIRFSLCSWFRQIIHILSVLTMSWMISILISFARNVEDLLFIFPCMTNCFPHWRIVEKWLDNDRDIRMKFST
jgi:hypothetical protein